MMKQIVLEVISHQSINVNSAKFERYKLKLLEEDRVFITDGFGSPDNIIQVGNVIEYMEIVNKLSGSELCEAFYKAKKIEEAYKKRVKEAEKLVRCTEEPQKGIWLPCDFGEELTVKGTTGRLGSMAYPFSYLKTYTYFLINNEGKIIESFKGNEYKSRIKGKYLDLALSPGYNGKIDKWFPFDKRARLRCINYKNDGKYAYHFTTEDSLPLVFITDSLVVNCKSKMEYHAKDVITEKNRKSIDKKVIAGQQDLFGMLL